jgi:phage host-nuclease inhibitor protein Gam
MINGKSPDWLQELLDAEEVNEEKQKLEMNKILADRALAAIGVIEDQINEVNEIAEKEITLIQQWNLSELNKLQKKIDWLVWNLSNYMTALGEKTVSLPHGQLKMRMGRDKVEVLDKEKFLIIGQKLGLLRHIKESYEPDLVAIAAYTKLHNNKPPVGVMLTPAQPKFSYKTITKGSNDVNDERNDEQTEARSNAGQTSKTIAA